MKSKKKLIILGLTVLALVLLGFVASSWIGQMLIGSVNQLQVAGEAPLPTEEIWVAPTMAPETDFTEEETQGLDSMPDAEPAPTEDADGSAPILESPEQLAGTADQSSIVDTNPGDD